MSNAVTQEKAEKVSEALVKDAEEVKNALVAIFTPPVAQAAAQSTEVDVKDEIKELVENAIENTDVINEYATKHIALQFREEFKTEVGKAKLRLQYYKEEEEALQSLKEELADLKTKKDQLTLKKSNKDAEINKIREKVKNLKEKIKKREEKGELTEELEKNRKSLKKKKEKLKKEKAPIEKEIAELVENISLNEIQVKLKKNSTLRMFYNEYKRLFDALVQLATEHAVGNNVNTTGVSQFQLVRNFLSHVASFKAQQQQQQTSAPVMSYAEPAPIGFMSQQQSLDAPMIMEIPSRTI